MSTVSAPTHPTGDTMKTKEYIRPMPATWFLHNRHLVVYALRELTSFFVAGYAIFLLVVLYYANQGKEQFGRWFFDKVLQSRLSLVLHLIVLAFVIFHSVASFNSMGRLVVVRRGEERVSPVLIAELNYALWLIVSMLIFLGVIVYKG